MAQGGHPVVAAVVLDSDGAQLIGYSPAAGRWGGWLMLDRIIGHILPDAWPKIVYWDEEADQPVMEAADDPDYQQRCQAAMARSGEKFGRQVPADVDFGGPSSTPP